MKWIFIAGLIVFTPAAAAFLRSHRRYLPHACFLMGLAIFFQGGFLSVSPIFWDWPGPVQGIQVGVVDALAVALIVSTNPVRIPLAFKLAVALLGLAILISSFDARQLMPVGFYTWQLIRDALVFLAIARGSAHSERAPWALVAGLGTALAIESVWVVRQFAGGDHEPGGSLGHRNILGMTTHFAVMPAFALFLGGYRSRSAAVVLLCGAIIILLGGSRATLGLFATGLGLVAFLSMRSRMTGRKGAVAAAAGFCILCAAPVMLWSIERRSQAELQSSDTERGAFIDAARMIIADHPLGIGANQYVIVANIGGYSDRAGVPWDYADRSAPVHNSYYLVTAELGLVGLLGLLSIFGSVIWIGLRGARQNRAPTTDLLAGLVAATIVLMVHIAFEWVFELAVVQFLTAAAFGAIIGIAAPARPRRAPRPRPVSVAADAGMSYG